MAHFKCMRCSSRVWLDRPTDDHADDLCPGCGDSLEAVAELRTIVKQLHTEGRPRTVRRRPGGRRPDPTRVPDEEVTT